MPPIDFTQQLKNFDGEPLTDAVIKDGAPASVPFTLSRLACTALLGNVPNEQPADAEEHVKRFTLAMQIRDNAKASLTDADMAILKDRIPRTFNNALIVGQAFVMLAETKKKAA